MKYLVMECGKGYAVVLDQEGRFLKAADRGYQVGQTVTEVFPLKQERKPVRWLYPLIAAAACVVLLITALFQNQAPYASVYLTINPAVKIDVGRKDLVVGLSGVNQDGRDLIEGYSYRDKDLDMVMDELVNMAIGKGYLHEGGKISLSFDAKSGEWATQKSADLQRQIQDHFSGQQIQVEVVDRADPPAQDTDDDDGLTDYDDTTGGDSGCTGPEEDDDPTEPEDDDDDDDTEAEDDPTEGSSDYGDTDYDDTTGGDSGYTDPEEDDDPTEPEDDDDTAPEDDDDDPSDPEDDDDDPTDGSSDYADGDLEDEDPED